ncbi:hypothetical protein ASPWEDRAFT_29104 [Aspergillus wentii DTO 134E9]|uniref:Uncharacterized protein n=1 Tax=Aspergillus wentii DTO 134E9 TaxID=1073089 RepID=A0A1L9RG58_ASPWE|nr:uncharacterized protein ASPWEDRAFT_29104 [Aspergillus wentii DTO 134E9]KAI9927703.1 hypothetical protein MW887_002555 [Aspergillus wentii]OJJ33915.1 hypothetical protein ASPWEDRAFT_29104 [Aspergillus wentii DTO 134E9]
MKSTNRQYHIHTANSRPDLWEVLEDAQHPLRTSWPLFLGQDAPCKHYSSKLAKYYGLAEFQFAIVEQDATTDKETIVACARSIPFYWPELDHVGGRAGLETNPEILQSLPNGGYDTILTRGVQQYLARNGLSPSITIDLDEYDHDEARPRTEPPNALSAISITVHPDRRSLGLAEALIQAMKQIAKSKNLDILVVPLRPTRKSEYPFVKMDEYITWRQPGSDLDLPFDPWLRKHVRLGARVIKVAWNSMRVDGNMAEWEHWMDGSLKLGKLGVNSDHVYSEVSFPGGLVPLQFYPLRDRCVYVEPNVWIYHDLAF